MLTFELNSQCRFVQLAAIVRLEWCAPHVPVSSSALIDDSFVCQQITS